VSREHFSRLWTLGRAGAELRRLGIDGPAQLAGQFMADAAALREVAAGVRPLVDDQPRRIGSALFAEPATPRYNWLMDAARGRQRLEAGPWASVLPPALVAESREGFRRRGILEAAFYPELRGADYNFWGHVAQLIRGTDLVELPRWLLGSGALAAAIAARRGAADPVAAEHLAIDAVANRRPAGAVDRARFAAMRPKGQLVTVFHHCLAGEPAVAWALMGWMREQGRARALDASFVAWAAGQCMGR
jgi:hypothetical protein